MTNFLFGAAAFILAVVTLALFRILRRPADVDRMMAVQLLGSGGVAVLLLIAVAIEIPAIVDVALMLALLAAFMAVTLVMNASNSRTEPKEAADPQ
jgi:multicomponent Na+:H+ antiporter subunit F